jgi:hypothetical protein
MSPLPTSPSFAFHVTYEASEVAWPFAAALLQYAVPVLKCLCCLFAVHLLSMLDALQWQEALGQHLWATDYPQLRHAMQSTPRFLKHMCLLRDLSGNKLISGTLPTSWNGMLRLQQMYVHRCRPVDLDCSLLVAATAATNKC